MSQAEPVVEADAAETPPVEPTRVLIPSSVGVLGLELVGETVQRVALAPVGRDRQAFTPLAELKGAARSDWLDEVIGRFSEYLAGARRHLELKYELAALGLPTFSRRVLRETAKIPYGRTRTYQQIATNAGRPDGYRQVLSALMVNPLPLVIPCHRVVTSKSGVGSYVGGTKRKTTLLRMERKNLSLL
jgi:methylated-DNA-[protein]-cysteine S-methyltransferase